MILRLAMQQAVVGGANGWSGWWEERKERTARVHSEQ